MDWLMAFVLLAIVGQFVLIKFLLAKRERGIVKLRKAQFLAAAANQQEAAAGRQTVSTSSQDLKITRSQKGACDE